MRSTHAGFELDDDRARLDRDALWSFLSTEAYWSRWRTRDQLEDQLASAWRVLGGYDADGALVAFCRAFSDGVGSAYLADVYVLPRCRGQGLGAAMVTAMLDFGPSLRWMLHTADAHELYARFGFAPPDGSYLERPRPGGAG